MSATMAILRVGTVSPHVSAPAGRATGAMFRQRRFLRQPLEGTQYHAAARGFLFSFSDIRIQTVCDHYSAGVSTNGLRRCQRAHCNWHTLLPLRNPFCRETGGRPRRQTLCDPVHGGLIGAERVLGVARSRPFQNAESPGRVLGCFCDSKGRKRDIDPRPGVQRAPAPGPWKHASHVALGL